MCFSHKIPKYLSLFLEQVLWSERRLYARGKALGGA
jgi:hypothetical protein